MWGRTSKRFSLFSVEQRISELCSISSTDDGDNIFKVLAVDYDDYIILHLRNINNGETFKLMELYGRVFSHRHWSWGGKRREERNPNSNMIFPAWPWTAFFLYPEERCLPLLALRLSGGRTLKSLSVLERYSMNVKFRTGHIHDCQPCCPSFSHPSRGALPHPSAQWMWLPHEMQSLLSLLFFTGRKPELSSNIKEKFVDLCKKHGIVEENILDLTGVGKSRLIYFSLSEFYIMINARDCQPDMCCNWRSI